MALILAALCSLVSNGSGERKEGIWTDESMGNPINGGSCGFLLTVSVFTTGPSSTETGWSWAWRLKEPANKNREIMSNRPLIQRRIVLKNNADLSLNESCMDPESHPSGSRFYRDLPQPFLHPYRLSRPCKRINDDSAGYPAAGHSQGWHRWIPCPGEAS